MTTQSTRDRADADLRALLAQADPEAGTTAAVPADLLDRVLAAAADPALAEPGEASGPADDAARATATTAGHGPTMAEHPSWLRRHWQGSLMAAAAVTSLALAAGTILPGLTGSTDSLAGAESAAVSEAAGGSDGALAPDMAGAVESERTAVGAPDQAVGSGAGTSGVPAAEQPDEALVRSASLLVGTEDLQAGRDSFVATVLGMGGRVLSETVVNESANGGVDPYLADSMAASRDMGMSYPYPWYPMGPGIWLTVQVPVEDYDKAVEAARATGEVVQMQQSSYDVGAQVSDVDVRIAALEASLARLTELMGQAKDVADVIALEQAIAQRQSELDALRAQQRDLANQTSMSTISLTLMSPEDAQQTVDPQPDQSWWESFLEGLEGFWTWLGSALLIISPLLLAMGIIAWVRRRQRRHRQAGPGAGEAAPEQPSA
jgi:hypothetical protein